MGEEEEETKGKKENEAEAYKAQWAEAETKFEIGLFGN